MYVDAVRRAIASLSSEGFERYFGALHQQLRSHHEDIERPVALPAGVRAPNAVVYKLDVFLGVDIAESGLEDRVRELADTHDLERSPSATELTGREVQRWAALGDELLEDTTAEDLTLEVGAVSGIHVGFPNARGEHEVQWADSPLERQPDARLELLPAEPGTLEEFQAFLDHHLRCQVRDRFVTMGLVPPEAFRVIGFGTFHDARRYDHYDLYPQLHLRDGEEGTLFS
ncbi:hypothetical protein [Natronobiforma cellulositropha]|uniref:hypothetical protein n=1 Tax=Natronobiforma cellulositropha TaxID=1679076 RepID=UPI0021D5BB58|nr:hypothetical protein [Natronobiforma cellulositropha]